MIEAPVKEPRDLGGPGGVRVEVVSRTFQSRRGEIHALQGMSLHAAPGEIVTVVGPSGCGKTTLLELICGLQQPDSGTVEAAPAVLMPQRDLLLPWLSALDSPCLALRARGIGRDEARRTVLSAYGAFSPRMAEIAEQFFTRRWIDAPVRPGKAPGAFSHPTVPSAHPYVLLNYQGKPRDVMTLAHELGHGVHQVLAAPNGALMAPTPLTLAETASVFGEMLTFRTLLAGIKEKAQRRAMLAAKVEDMINTVVRQIAFYGFERKVHVERKNGELTAERLGEIWLEVQGESLGSVAVSRRSACTCAMRIASGRSS